MIKSCDCKGCEKERETRQRHLKHPFYKAAHDYREEERRAQILKGADKYPEPFNPDSWSAKELLSHAMQENVDQAHYIYGLFDKLDQLEREAKRAEEKAEAHRIEAAYWMKRAKRGRA